MKYNSAIFAERLKQVRKERGLSQQALGEMIGVTTADRSLHKGEYRRERSQHERTETDLQKMRLPKGIRERVFTIPLSNLRMPR